MKTIKNKVASLLATSSIDKPLLSASVRENINACLNAFYNNPTWAKPNMVYSKLAATLTNYMATLATNEINIHTGESQRAEYIKQILEKELIPNLRQYVQLAGVGGQVILKPYIEKETIKIECVTVSRFTALEENNSGEITKAVFLDYGTLNKKKVVRLETHELKDNTLHIKNNVKYVLDDGRFVGDIPLEKTKWFALAEFGTISPAQFPLFTTFKMPFVNTFDEFSHVPMPLFSNSLSTIEQIDTVYTQLIENEIGFGSRRIMTDITALKGEAEQSLFNRKDRISEIIVGLCTDGDIKNYFQDFSPVMRVDEILKALSSLFRLIEKQCGFSTGTVNIDSGGNIAVTATEIISKDKDTYNTIHAIQQSGLKNGLIELIYIINQYIDIYELAPKGDINPTVDFGDSIFEDTDKVIARYKAFADSGYIKPEIAIAKAFGISQEEARDMQVEQNENISSFFKNE